MTLDEMSSRKVRKKLRKAGCREKKGKGSHTKVQCPPDKTTTVPLSKDLPRGTLKAIENQSGVRIKEELLRKFIRMVLAESSFL